MSKSQFILIATLGVLGAVTLAHNLHLFDVPVFEDGDFACNSLLVLQAKRLELLHGHYSRLGFYHPGPAILYVLAGSEWLLHDTLGIVPAPHNAHMLGTLALNVFLLAFCTAIVARAYDSRWAGAAAALVFLVYFALHGTLAYHWFAFLYLPIYLAFQISAASVASGRLTHLGWLAVSAGLAVHGHASLIPFVLLVCLYAFVCLWRHGGFKYRSLAARERRAWWLYAAIVAVFLWPIVLHTMQHFPAELGRYITYAQREHGDRPPWDEIVMYMVRALTAESRLGWMLILAVFGGAVLAVPQRHQAGRSFAIHVLVVCLLSTVAMAYYLLRGADELHVHLGIFYGSVLLLGWLLIGARLATCMATWMAAGMTHGWIWRSLGLTGGLALGVWAAVAGNFRNQYAGDRQVAEFANAIADDPAWQSGPPLLTLHHECWPETAELLILLERRGLRPRLLDRYWDIILTDKYRLDGSEPLAPLWQIDFALKSERQSSVRRVISETNRISIREMEPSYPLDENFLVVGGSRHMAVKPETGWFASNSQHLRPIAREATLRLAVRPPLPDKVLLTVRGACPAQHVPGGQRVGICVNGQHVGDVVFASTEFEDQSVVVPGELLARHASTRIKFTFPDAYRFRARWYSEPEPWFSILITDLKLTSLDGELALAPAK